VSAHRTPRCCTWTPFRRECVATDLLPERFVEVSSRA